MYKSLQAGSVCGYCVTRELYTNTVLLPSLLLILLLSSYKSVCALFFLILKWHNFFLNKTVINLLQNVLVNS